VPVKTVDNVTQIFDGRLSPAAADILRGTCRFLNSLGFSSIPEVSLPDGRRADIVAINNKGTVWIVEIKSSPEDFRTDNKWIDYKAHCDEFYFAVNSRFPKEILPQDEGLIIADRYGGDLLRNAEIDRISGARRKIVTLRSLETAARRQQVLFDPGKFQAS